MLVKRSIIYSITIVIALLAAITGGSLYHISQQKKSSEAYNTCKPYQYITTPHEAHLIIVQDNRKLSWKNLPLRNASALPNEKIWRNRTRDNNQPLYIAHYTDNQTVIWCAIQPGDRERVCRFITDSLCNGYRPIEEEGVNGTLLHFSTHDNRFLHLFFGNSVMGCSYDLEKLTQAPDANSDLGSYIESLGKTSGNTLIYFNSSYERYNIEPTKSGCNLTFTSSQCPIDLEPESATIDTTLLSAAVKTFIQINTHTNPNLSPTATLAYIPSQENPEELTSIYATHITDPRKLHRELLAIYTPYGYHADSAKVAQWMPQAFITEKDYWITTNDSTLYAAHSYKELEQYIDDIKSHRRMSHASESSASLFIVSDSIVPTQLPHSIATQLPPIAQGASSICIEKASEGYKWKIKFE